MAKFKWSNYVNALVVIAALGYFVDIYDLILFSIVRVPSLKSLGLTGTALFDTGVLVLNAQMAGMLLGGILWGILGDRRGRLSVLFGSILLYSTANIANGFVHSVDAYLIWRFIAGIGLAGELGAGITLVTETLPKETRGWGTMMIASVGISGAILAGTVAELFDWRMCYWIGGGLGFLLLLLRVGAYESGLYKSVQHAGVSRGRFISLFTSWKRFFKYLRCILIGLPTWYVIGILVTFSPEFAKTLGIVGNVSAGRAVMVAYGGLVVGDVASGILSQILKSRRKVVAVFLGMAIMTTAAYFYLPIHSVRHFYWACFGLGVSVGYWAIFVTVAAEQFGTNLRATVATTVPNFIRGSIIPLTALFAYWKPQLGIVGSGVSVGILCIGLAFSALFAMEETFGKELDYIEHL
jgi:MFS family permease